MGNFSRDTFDRLKHYVSVRLQQGVPIVDADWNELQDIRKHEVESFLKWFVGNGVPLGNDGFAIDRIPDVPNDLTIAAGRCLVEGWDVVNEGLVRYTAQELYGDVDRAQELGVEPLSELTTPSAARVDTVYLDVWEREVSHEEDPSIVNPAIGIETCVRTKREWVVRVAEGAGEPPAAQPGHVVYPLATLDRQAGEGVIARVVDRRRTGLTIFSYRDFQQIAGDAYGPGYLLDGGGRRQLRVSLREAINALLAGGLPATATEQFSFGAGNDSSLSVLRDANDDVWVFWESNRGGSQDIWYRRYRRADVGWTPETQVTSSADQKLTVNVLEDHAGDVWVFWRSSRAGKNGIWYKRYVRSSGIWGVETPLTADSPSEICVIAAGGSGLWAFYSSFRSGNFRIWYQRYDPTTDRWGGESQLTAAPGVDSSPVAFQDSKGLIWVLWVHDSQIWCLYIRADGTSVTSRVTEGTDYNTIPRAVETGSGDILVFWIRDQDSLWLRRYDRATATWGNEIELVSDLKNVWLSAFRSAEGDAGVLWASHGMVYCKRNSAENGWGPVVRVSPESYTGTAPTAVADAKDVWVFWQGQTLVDPLVHLYSRRFVTEI